MEFKNYVITYVNNMLLKIKTDYGARVSSKSYSVFVIKREEYFCLSIERENISTDNSIAERFM